MRALYLLGAEDRGLPPAVLRQCHQVVRIPCPVDRPLNVAVAGSVVIHDRYAKWLSGTVSPAVHAGHGIPAPHSHAQSHDDFVAHGSSG
jgi:tRNA C32,U32 (ribose-2'-O)-methylase TrmJ